MTSYRLHYFPESGNSYKLALMLTLCGAKFDLVWTDFGGGVTWTPEWRRTVNEMGEIPVLEEDDRRLTQTGPILLRLAERYGKLAGDDPDEKFEVLRWLFWDNHKLSGYVAAYRYRRAFTPSPDPAEQKFLRRRIDDFLRIADAHFERNAFAAGRNLTIADVSMIAYLSYPSEETGFDLPNTHPALHAWLGRVAATPGWKAPYDMLPGNRLELFVR